MSIEVQNITKIYSGQKALDDVSFTIKPGEIIGFLGPNGAGKTTMMKIITCFIPPTAGNVRVYGYDIVEQSVEVRKKVGYLPENNPLYTEMYIKEYLEFVAGIYKPDFNISARVQEMIAITGLELEQKKKISTLSRGYRQRVGLAQALIHDPDVLILDEPTTGLDPNQIVEIRNLIKNIGKEKTVMLSTHIMQEVEAICSRAIIIDRGKIIADDQMQHLSESSIKNEIIIVEFNKEIAEKTLLGIPGVKRVKKMNGNFWEMESVSDIDIRNTINHFAKDNDLFILSLHKPERNLEKIFQELTQK
ncbi:MAG: gliding motility-associated ABC transporter ATP-binding subunit GldA [Lentimicrobiaceae bacterium]|jgi:ABC-2 type transport system ATP-binding protein|nr:gliding motility-associated ABC transporter ATP-binding subunit GldA [Lentimicrobiaceae bacterium]